MSATALEKRFKYGCPYCGKNVGGSPTDRSFRWDICTSCIGKLALLSLQPVGETAEALEACCVENTSLLRLASGRKGGGTRVIWFQLVCFELLPRIFLTPRSPPLLTRPS